MRKIRQKRYLWNVLIVALSAAVVLAGCGGETPREGPISLTYATFSPDFEMEQWIAEWNRSQDDIE